MQDKWSSSLHGICRSEVWNARRNPPQKQKLHPCFDREFKWWSSYFITGIWNCCILHGCQLSYQPLVSWSTRICLTFTVVSSSTITFLSISNWKETVKSLILRDRHCLRPNGNTLCSYLKSCCSCQNDTDNSMLRHSNKKRYIYLTKQL